MKYLILIFVFCVLKLSSQNTIIYLVGSEKIPGYTLKTCNFELGSIKINEAGAAPILQVYVQKKDEFIGGVLENEFGAKTTITNIVLKIKNKCAVFTVVGKDFSRSMTLLTGAILKEDKNTTLFYTDNIGIWKMAKK